jgi:hypothetical protein
MWPAWNHTAIAAVFVGAYAVATRRVTRKGWELLHALARELTIVLILYSIWQYVESLSLSEFGNAFANGRWIWRFERAWHLPGELALQHQMIQSRLLTQAADLFYATVHAPALGLFLIWLWFRHRDQYPRIRNNLALVTGACLVIQLIPVAPPRMFPEFGFIDTLARFGPISVYGSVGHGGLSDQIGAMPSIHCAWALLVGLGVVTVSTSRWRWLFLAHPIITFLVVAATGNHWWLDGIVAGALLGLSSLVQTGAVATWSLARRHLPARAGRTEPQPDPEPSLVTSSSAGPSRAG